MTPQDRMEHACQKRLTTAWEAAGEVAIQIEWLIERDFEHLSRPARRALTHAQFHANVMRVTLEMLWSQALSLEGWLDDKASIATGRELLAKVKDHCGHLSEHLREAHRIFVARGKYPEPIEHRLIDRDGSYSVVSRMGISWFLLMEMAEDLPPLVDEADASLTVADLAAG